VLGMGVLAAIGLFVLVLPALDAGSHGPYSTWYNRRCQRLADRAGLIGRPELAVVRVLGSPTFTYEFPEVYPDIGKWTRTYNYAPCPWAPHAKFQVHCQAGIVIDVEQFDD
jgi:hypothetical protein